MFCQEAAITPDTHYFAHRDADRLVEVVLHSHREGTVVIDLSGVEDVTTSAFARLVLLRRELRRRGLDLRLMGLHDRAEMAYEINRLGMILPRC